MVSVFFLHKFAAASFETTGPEAIQSKKEKEGGEERKSEQTEGMISCLSKQCLFHPEALCILVLTTLDDPALPLCQASDGKRLQTHLRSVGQSDLGEIKFTCPCGCLKVTGDM